MLNVEKAGLPPAGRRPTPRPNHSAPQVIRRGDAVHHVWGDREAGFVTDRVISSTRQLHVLEYDLPPGGEFRHSAMNQTVFGGDVLYYVLEGELVLANPESGEVVRAPAGTGRLFHRGTWHNGFNPGSTSLRVLEFFSPPPARGTASDYSRTQPPLDEVIYHDPRWDGRWPEAREEKLRATSFHDASEHGALLSMRDSLPSHLVATLVDTPFLRVVEGTVQPGHVEEFAPVAKESLIYTLEGELWVDVWSEEQGYQATSVLLAGDAIFLPVGCAERVLVRSATPARYLRGSGDVPEDWTP